MKILKNAKVALLSSVLFFSIFSPVIVKAVDSATQSTLLQSTVRIRYERRENGNLITGHGTAFGVNLCQFGYAGKRYLLTAAHNVLDVGDSIFPTLSIEINDGTRTYWSPCKVAALDKQLDICLVEASEDLSQVMELDNAEAAPGVPIVLAGSPRGIPVNLYKGDVIKVFEGGSIRSSARVEFDHGDSGGPVMNAQTQKIAGVAVAGFPKDGDLDHTRGMFVPLVAINSFLHSNQRGNSIASSPATTIAMVQASSEKKSSPVVNAIVINTDDEETVVLGRPTFAVKPKVLPAAPVAQIVPTPEPVAVAHTVPMAPARVTAVQNDIVPVTVKAPVPAKHVVVSGDTLSQIARKYNTTSRELIRLNQIKDPNIITIGSSLILPSNP